MKFPWVCVSAPRMHVCTHDRDGKPPGFASTASEKPALHRIYIIITDESSKDMFCAYFVSSFSVY